MKDQNLSASPIEITANKFSRRKFLTAAGASVLALPLVKSWPVLGQDTTTTDPNHPNPWMMRGANPVGVAGMVASSIPVTGVRHYSHPIITDPPDPTKVVPSAWPSPPDMTSASASNCTVPASNFTIPNLQDVSMCVTIYPAFNDLMCGNYNGNLASMLNKTQPREMLSCWHEASSMNYYDTNGIHITADLQTAMQTYLYNFAKTGNGKICPTPFQIQNPVYQCAVGGIDIGNWSKVQPWMAPNLDFYGIDLYSGNFPDPLVPLEEWKDHVYGTSTIPAYSPNATIAVCECNCTDDCDRPNYFYQAANWVWNQTNRGARSFLTFWNGTGNLGGCWPPGFDTLAELRRIGNQDYSNPALSNPAGIKC